MGGLFGWLVEARWEATDGGLYGEQGDAEPRLKL